MKRKRFTEKQIAFALRRADGGTSVEEVCRKRGVSEPAASGMSERLVVSVAGRCPGPDRAMED